MFHSNILLWGRYSVTKDLLTYQNSQEFQISRLNYTGNVQFRKTRSQITEIHSLLLGLLYFFYNLRSVAACTSYKTKYTNSLCVFVFHCV
jgi:hypothetical protein